MGPKTYLVNGGSLGGPRHDRSGNAILALPYQSSALGTLNLRGVNGLTQIYSSLTGQSYSSQYGCPSILGGPTPEQLGHGGQFSLWRIGLSDLIVSAIPNTTLCGIDLSRVVRCRVQDVIVQTTNPAGVAPTNVYSFALRLPDGLNYGSVGVEQVDVYGFYTGIVCNTSHTQILRAGAKWCALGWGLTGSGEYDSIDPHASMFGLINSEWCTLHMGGWSPSGAGSLPSGAPFYLYAQVWDIEDGPTGSWYSTYAHLVDANNELYGHATYLRVKANVGVQSGPLTLSGGGNIKLVDMSSAGGVAASTRPSQVELPPNLLHNRKDRPFGPLPEPAFRERIRHESGQL